MRRGTPYTVSFCAFTAAVALAAAPLRAAPPTSVDAGSAEVDAELQALGALAGTPAEPALAPATEHPRAASPGAIRALKQARSAPLRSIVARAKPSNVVDCTKGQKIQAAINVGAEPLVVEVRGICQENVRIERKQVTLRGLDPANDGVQGVVDFVPAVAVLYSLGVTLENLSISNGAANGLRLWSSEVFASNCRLTSNAFNGIQALAGSFLSGEALTISNNGTFGIHARESSEAVCVGCLVQNNASWAALSVGSSLISLQDSTVSGGRGLLALSNGYVDLDCVSAGTGEPCSLNATISAGAASDHATVAFFGDQEFSGPFSAFAQSSIYLFGAQQQPGPGSNQITTFSSLLTEPDGQESQLGQTDVTGFSRALVTGATVLDGDLTCDSAGDAWLDPGVVSSPGVMVAGCEHAGP